MPVWKLAVRTGGLVSELCEVYGVLRTLQQDCDSDYVVNGGSIISLYRNGVGLLT